MIKHKDGFIFEGRWNRGERHDDGVWKHRQGHVLSIDDLIWARSEKVRKNKALKAELRRRSKAAKEKRKKAKAKAKNMLTRANATNLKSSDDQTVLSLQTTKGDN